MARDPVITADEASRPLRYGALGLPSTWVLALFSSTTISTWSGRVFAVGVGLVVGAGAPVLGVLAVEATGVGFAEHPASAATAANRTRVRRTHMDLTLARTPV